MNIYADRGNLLVLERRCRWRGIGFELHASGLGEQLDADAHDLFYIGGGQDRDQRLCADDLLANKRAGLHAAAARGAVILGVCGGYQLLGHSYTLGSEEIAGVSLLDVRTVRSDRPRLIGNVAIEVALAGRRARRRARAGRLREPRRAHPPRRRPASPRPRPSRLTATTALGPRGGDRAGNTIGTYLHGPLLPKNAWFADWLIARALGSSPAGWPRSGRPGGRHPPQRPPRGRPLSVLLGHAAANSRKLACAGAGLAGTGRGRASIDRRPWSCPNTSRSRGAPPCTRARPALSYPALGLPARRARSPSRSRSRSATTAASSRPERREALSKELGDVLWYLAQLATELDLDLDEVAQANLEKLLSRQRRGVLSGSGDDR